MYKFMAGFCTGLLVAVLTIAPVSPFRVFYCTFLVVVILGCLVFDIAEKR